jgi:cytochrome b6-f complex iron-sulfur subunit
MDRAEFLKLIGVVSSGAVIASCMGGCSKDSSTEIINDVNLSLDLATPTYSALLTQGSFVQLQSSGIVVAFATDGKYYAANLVCPHEKGEIEYNEGKNQFQCLKHPTQFFTNSGVSNQSETKKNLTTYTCTLVGKILTVKK